MLSYSWNNTCCEPPRTWRQGKPKFPKESKYTGYTCQSLEVVLQQSRDERATFWTATTWFRRAGRACTVKQYSWSYTGSTRVMCGSAPHTRLLLILLPPLLRSYLANHISKANSHLLLSALTGKSYLRPHCSYCKTSSLKEGGSNNISVHFTPS